MKLEFLMMRCSCRRRQRQRRDSSETIHVHVSAKEDEQNAKPDQLRPMRPHRPPTRRHISKPSHIKERRPSEREQRIQHSDVLSPQRNRVQHEDLHAPRHTARTVRRLKSVVTARVILMAGNAVRVERDHGVRGEHLDVAHHDLTQDVSIPALAVTEFVVV